MVNETTVKKERFKTNTAVFLVLLREQDSKKEVLLQLRQNTGYMDGKWDFAATGHLEKDELIEDAVIREALEEINIKIDKKDLSLGHMRHYPEDNYYNFFFACESYFGTPEMMEKERCAELKWFDVNELPDNLIDHNKGVIPCILSGKYYEIGSK